MYETKKQLSAIERGAAKVEADPCSSPLYTYNANWFTTKTKGIQ